MARSLKRARDVTWRWWALLAVAALVAVIAPSTPSGADHVGTVSGVFESADGNLVNDHVAPSPSVDWNDFAASATLSADFNFTGALNDATSPDDIFGGGAKQDSLCPRVTTGSAGNKNDIKRLYLAQKDDFLYLAWVRVPQNSQTASAHVAFEFNQSEDTCTAAEGAASNLKLRTEGDVLIVYDFEGGSAAPTFKVVRWLDTNTVGTCEVHNASKPCWGNPITLAGNADGAVNVGVTVDDDIAGEQLGPVEFGEAAIRLSAADLDDCDVSGFVTGVSRTSGNSGTAQMKDKVGPFLGLDLDHCKASPIITTTMRVSDTATLHPWNPEGDGVATLTFSLYGPQDDELGACTAGNLVGTPLYVSPVSTATLMAGSTNTWAAPGFYELTATGTYRWVVDYTGDSHNDPDRSGCGSEVITIGYDF